MKTTQSVPADSTSNASAAPLSLAEIAVKNGVSYRDVAAYVSGNRRVRLVALLALLFGSACSAGENEPAPVCAWADDSMACEFGEYSHTKTVEVDGDITCVHHTYTCVVAGTPSGPECAREVYDCQPNVVLGGPNPGAPRQ